MNNQDKNIFCPHCGIELKKTPLSKTWCTNCKNYMYVRSLPITEQRVVITEKEKDKIDKDRKAWIEFKKLKSREDLADKDFINAKEELKKQYGFEPPLSDVVWAVYGKLVFKYAKDYSRLWDVWYSRAIFITKENKDPNLCLKEAAKASLNDFKEQGINKVEIIVLGEEGNHRFCSNCIKSNGKILTIDEALTTMPIPNPNCSFKFKEGQYSFCRCSYNPKFDW